MSPRSLQKELLVDLYSSLSIALCRVFLAVVPGGTWTTVGLMTELETHQMYDLMPDSCGKDRSCHRKQFYGTAPISDRIRHLGGGRPKTSADIMGSPQKDRHARVSKHYCPETYHDLQPVECIYRCTIQANFFRGR